MEVSEDDLQLVNALQLAPRASWVEIGATLDRHPTTVAAQWERLRSSGLAWITAHLSLRTDERTLALVDIECDFSRRRQLAEELGLLPEVLTVEESSQSRDLMLIVSTASWDTFAHSLLPHIASMPHVIRHRSTICTRVHSTADAWTLGALNARQQRTFAELGRQVPLSFDAPRPPAFGAIAEQLAFNGRATATEIAAATGLNAVTARRQLARVLKMGGLTFRCEIAQGSSGRPIGAQWHTRVPPHLHESAAAFLYEFRGLRFCCSTMGPANFVFMMWITSTSEAADVEQAFLTAFPEASILESQPTLGFTKRMGWLLDDDGTATGKVIPLLH